MIKDDTKALALPKKEGFFIAYMRNKENFVP